MFIHRSTRSNTAPVMGASSRGSLRKRLASAFSVLVHGEGESRNARLPLDPRIVAGIDRHAAAIADAYGDPLAGSFARDILTESAHVIVDSYGVPADESAEPDDTGATAAFLAQGRRRPS